MYLGGGGLYMDKYLRFETAIFCSSNSNFCDIFCTEPVFITDFSLFFLLMYLQLSIGTMYS